MSGSTEIAKDHFAQGFNCAQSIVAAFGPQCGISDELGLKLAAPFGAGMARRGEVCGALSGALLVLGLRYARPQPEGREETYRIAREFIEQFRRQHGAIACRELLGYDISTPEGLQAARDDKVFAVTCPLLVEQTAAALAAYIAEHPDI